MHVYNAQTTKDGKGTNCCYKMKKIKSHTKKKKQIAEIQKHPHAHYCYVSNEHLFLFGPQIVNTFSHKSHNNRSNKYGRYTVDAQYQKV